MSDSRGLQYFTVLLSVMSLLVATRSVAAESVIPRSVRETRVPIEQDWSGIVPIAVRKQAPKVPYVADSATWKKLWRAFKGKNEKVPKIDFDKSLILVAIGRDPNLISVEAARGIEGNIWLTTSSTMMLHRDSENCRYYFAQIKRDGIKTINEKPIVATGAKQFWDKFTRLIRLP